MPIGEMTSIIGLAAGKVLVAPYSVEWQRLFAEERSRLLAAVGAYVQDVQHVGSTSIPGMAAKPIIDIGIAVRNFEEASVCVGPIEHLGYEYRGENGIPRRRYFERGNPRTHHLHMNEMGSRAWTNQILFRDFLIQHAEIAQEYATIKMSLAQVYPSDRDAYLAAKAPFIERVLRLARGIDQE
jgi:GrpB-like predicted nucleotidyltransferase (UPF0157 family)